MPLTRSRPPQFALNRIPGALEEPIKLLKITHVISRGKFILTKIITLFQVAITLKFYQIAGPWVIPIADHSGGRQSTTKSDLTID